MRFFIKAELRGLTFLQGLAILFSLTTHGQHKPVSYEQAFENAPTGLFKSLPGLRSWISDQRFVLSHSSEKGNQQRLMVVDLVTKTIQPYNLPEKPSTLIYQSKKLPKEVKSYTLSPDSSFAAYTFNNNLFTISTSTEEITQLSFDGNDSILNGYAPWLYEEEIFGEHKAFWWSNDSRTLVFMRFDESKVPLFPIYVPSGQYGYLQMQRYPKAGDINPKVKIGIIDIQKKNLLWAQFSENNDQYFRTLYFTPKNQLWVQWINRKQDTLKLFEINLQNGSKREVYTEGQKTWVTQNDGVYFIPDKDVFINRSDKSGWSHYYLHDFSGRLINPITSGKFNVGYIIRYDFLSQTIFFTARKENSTRIDIYQVGTDGKNLKRISSGPFTYSNISFSPSGKFFIATYSNTTTPSSMAVFDMKGNKLMDLGTVIGPHFKEYNLPEKELNRIRSTDSLFDLPFTITYPANFDRRKKYPVLMSVYGGPYAMNVNDAWSLSPTEIWWAQEGIIQVTADNRASGHFGKEGMNHIYGQSGIPETEDFMAIGRWLKQQSWVDSSKLCITGFSHGGYLTCMALTYGAAVFNYGIAYWPVTDWRLVDSYFVERYMGHPESNREGYRITSVMNYVDRYRGLLRLVHGTSDNNAHMQNTLQLADALQNFNKKFELMIYPGQSHGLSGAKWKHNKTETYRFYYKNLLNKNLPAFFE